MLTLQGQYDCKSRVVFEHVAPVGPLTNTPAESLTCTPTWAPFYLLPTTRTPIAPLSTLVPGTPHLYHSLALLSALLPASLMCALDCPSTQPPFSEQLPVPLLSPLPALLPLLPPHTPFGARPERPWRL